MAETVTKMFHSQAHGDLYQFRYVKNGNRWEVYIELHPPNPRGGSSVDTHILPGNRLCIAGGYEPKTLEQAIARSWTWIHYFSTYIRTGSTKQASVRVNVPDYDEEGKVK